MIFVYNIISIRFDFFNYTNQNKDSILILFFFQISGQILVRELWIGNLPNDCNQAILKKNLEIYGDIDNIDFFPKVLIILKINNKNNNNNIHKQFKSKANLKIIEPVLLIITLSIRLRRISPLCASRKLNRPPKLSRILGTSHCFCNPPTWKCRIPIIRDD